VCFNASKCTSSFAICDLSFVTAINPASQWAAHPYYIGLAHRRRSLETGDRSIEDSHGEQQPPSVPGSPRREGLPPRGDGGVGGEGQAWAHGLGYDCRVLLLPPRVLPGSVSG